MRFPTISWNDKFFEATESVSVAWPVEQRAFDKNLDRSVVGFSRDDPTQ